MASLFGLGSLKSSENVLTAKFDRDPVHALHALKSDFESFYQKMQQGFDSLSAAIGSEMDIPETNGAKGDDGEIVSPCEPQALLSHQQQIKEEDRKGSGHEKRYVVSCGVKQGSADIRLHGMWMELSTHKVAATAMTKQPSRRVKRISKRGESQLFDSDTRLASLCPVIQPAGRFRLAWDAAGLLFIMQDAFVLPMALAWDLQGSFSSVGDTFLLLSFWCSVAFWSADLILNFFTAFYTSGKLVVDRKRIVFHYMRTWLIFDLSLLGLDFVNAFAEIAELGALRTLRSLRIVRAFRLLRLLKMSKLQDILQEIAASTGQQWIMLVMAIVRMTFVILVVAHMLTCLWFRLGYETERWAEREGLSVKSWIQISAEDEQINMALQYLHSLRYVMNAPSPPGIHPLSESERFFDIMLYVFVLGVIGSAVSTILGTLQELNAMNEASARQRREVRMYLTSQNASFELVSRIMKFVDYKLQKLSMVTFDPNLISTTLQTELFVGQRSRFLERIPIFRLAGELFPDVFAAICSVLVKNVYEQKEHVFLAGAWSTALYVAAAGNFDYSDEFGTQELIDSEHWFGELSLYSEATIHTSTLTAKTFAEVFALSGKDLAECVRDSPGCTSMFCEYAKEYVSCMQKLPHRATLEDMEHFSQKCCAVNQFYQILYPDPSKLFFNIAVAKRVKEAEIKDRLKDNQTISMGVTGSKAANMNAEYSNHLPPAFDDTSQGTADTEIEDPGLLEVLQKVETQGMQDTLAKDVESHIPELHSQFGSHIIFEQAPERDRALSSIISILALVHDRYHAFTEPQAPPVKLRQEQWEALRKMILVISPTLEQVHAVVVLLSIRALGKNKTVMNQVPKDSQRPERAVLHLMSHVKNVVPSVEWLSEESLNYVTNALLVHETFNLAQMLQGENVPGNIAELHKKVNEQGQSSFHFYMLFLLGFMSGLAGGQGSRFMNAKNAEGAIAGFSMLQKLLESPPRAIYWGYMSVRAKTLKIPYETAEDLALIRLACLSRLQNTGDYPDLRQHWDDLGAFQKEVLVEHFLADGIENQAFVLEFLPMCVANARANPLVGLTLLLEVLVELLTNLQQAVQGLKQVSSEKMLPVDLMDMSEFIAAVQNRFVFQSCVSRCSFRVAGTRVNVDMTGRNWGRTNDQDSDLTTLAYEVKGILANQRHHHRPH